MKKKNSAGAPRKWEYKGVKKVTSIRLSDDDKKIILKNFSSLQEFIQNGIERLKKRS